MLFTQLIKPNYLVKLFHRCSTTVSLETYPFYSFVLCDNFAVVLDVSMYLNETTAVLFDRLRMLLKLYHEHLNIASIRKKIIRLFTLEKKISILRKKTIRLFTLEKKCRFFFIDQSTNIVVLWYQKKTMSFFCYLDDMKDFHNEKAPPWRGQWSYT